MSIRRWLVIGDPQTTLEKLLSVLEHNGALDDEGRLREDVGLVSMGDHFDYHIDGTEEARLAAAAEGTKVLRWFAGHPRERVRILAGNHDLVRVQELHAVSDDEFRAIRSGELSDGDLANHHPTIPTRSCCQRDFSAFTTEQRELVQRLLLEGRFDLALHGEIDGASCLLTHAGITRRELRILDAEYERDVRALAARMNEAFAGAIDAVRSRWEAGETVPLDLAPLHRTGHSGVESGGCLAHRPANPERPGADHEWEFHAEFPRRFDPRFMPKGVTQVVGHTQHRKLKKELRPWVDPRTHDVEHRLRTVVVDQGVRYVPGVVTAEAHEASLVCTDFALHQAPATVELLEMRVCG